MISAVFQVPSERTVSFRREFWYNQLQMTARGGRRLRRKEKKLTAFLYDDENVPNALTQAAGEHDAAGVRTAKAFAWLLNNAPGLSAGRG